MVGYLELYLSSYGILRYFTDISCFSGGYKQSLLTISRETTANTYGHARQ